MVSIHGVTLCERNTVISLALVPKQWSYVVLRDVQRWLSSWFCDKFLTVKFRMTISQCDCCYDLCSPNNQYECSTKWRPDQCDTGTRFVLTLIFFHCSGADKRRTLMTFYSCILTCVVTHDSVGVIIVESTYITIDEPDCSRSVGAIT